MQEHTAKNVRIAILLWLLALAFFSPYLISNYERRVSYQWEDIVQPHWEKVSAQPENDLSETDPVSQDAVQWKNVDVPVAEDIPVIRSEENIIVAGGEKPAVSVKKKMATAPEASLKKRTLKLKVPENLYQGHSAKWDEKKPPVLPDFFAPKQDEPSRLQLGGHLIIDETQKKPLPDASYLDAIKGAEINISIKTQ